MHASEVVDFEDLEVKALWRFLPKIAQRTFEVFKGSIKELFSVTSVTAGLAKHCLREQLKPHVGMAICFVQGIVSSCPISKYSILSFVVYCL